MTRAATFSLAMIAVFALAIAHCLLVWVAMGALQRPWPQGSEDRLWIVAGVLFFSFLLTSALAFERITRKAF